MKGICGRLCTSLRIAALYSLSLGINLYLLIAFRRLFWRMTSYRQSDGDIIIFSNFSFRIATMVRLNGLGTRHTAQTKVLRKEIWQAVVIIALASLSVFLVSQQGQNSAPEKELKQTVLSTTRGFLKSQSKANECEAAVDRLVESKCIVYVGLEFLQQQPFSHAMPVLLFSLSLLQTRSAWQQSISTQPY